MKRVVILSPSNFSLYTLCVIVLLRLKGLKVEAVIVRRLFNFKRIVFEFRKKGLFELLVKVWDKVFLCGKAYDKESEDNLSSLKRQLNLNFNTIKGLCRHCGIPVIFCDNLNDDNVIFSLKKSYPDLVIFTGGGLISKKVLECVGNGIINCHMGILPQYRGMHVIERAILENRFDCIGITVHFMDEGIDTGDILRIKRVDLIGCRNIKQLKGRFERVMCEEIVNTAIDYLAGFVERKPQRKEDGRQYIRMPYYLRKTAENFFIDSQKQLLSKRNQKVKSRI